MKTARELIDTVGVDLIQKAAGVGYKTVNRNINTGQMPASWFNVIERLCIEKGIECPRSLFNFKISSDPAIPSHTSGPGQKKEGAA